MGLNLETHPQSMYVYELPYDINKELCRLLDNEDYWKELAGNYMQYTEFDVNEIEQISKRQAKSPTSILLSKWGQLNHKVNILFMLLYKMNHVPALRCLLPVVTDERVLMKFDKLLRKNGVETSTVDVNANKPKPNACCIKSDSSLPIPVMQIEKGAQSPTPSKPVQVTSTTDASSSVTDSRHTSTQGDKESDDELIRNISAIPMITHEELREATNQWSNSNLLGRGGFGQVFKGVWRQSHVAVKRLRENGGQNRELIREISSLNKYRHDNILPLYGYSVGGPEVCLIYQYMAGGSLEQRLRSKQRALAWGQRLLVAHGVARGLQFLHTMCRAPLIHGDIKPANILLDQCSTPKIGDFGLARIGPDSNQNVNLKVSKVHGTRPYLPREYLRDRYLYPSVDVFSFGVVMLEVATALPVIDRNRKKELTLLSCFVHEQNDLGVDMATFEDPSLQGTPSSNPQLCKDFISIGLRCTEPLRKDRPEMLDVYKQLDKMKDMFKTTQVVS